ncbi:MAG: CHAT domain-containing protein [Streptosporangiaceae bacterium]
MTSTISDPPTAADRTVRLSAELRPADNRVVVQAAGGPIAEFPYEEDSFRLWQQSLRHQIHGSQRAAREAEFLARTGAMAEQLAVLIDGAELPRLVDAVDSDPSATVFLRVELARRELDIIPWELLSLPIANQASVRDVCVYRAVRARRRQATPPDPPQRVLLVDSSPLTEQSVNFAVERKSIRRELGAMRLAGLVDPDLCPDADPGMLTAALARPTRAVHVAAQGDVGEVHLRQGTKDVKYPAEPFAQFFSREPQPVAVILSVCDSVPASPQALGVARAVAEAGVAEVIGMYSVITPEAALEFFTGLYRALGRCSDMATAYAAAVAALRADTYPNHGFWSVPVLYSYDNVIVFPGTLGDPRGSYRRIVDQVERFHAQLSGLRPKECWSENTWRLETMKLRVDADDRRQQLVQLTELVQPEARSGSKWAADVSRAAHTGLRALDGVVTCATNPRPGASAVDKFAESKAELMAVLEELYEAISARLQFSH